MSSTIKRIAVCLAVGDSVTGLRVTRSNRWSRRCGELSKPVWTPTRTKVMVEPAGSHHGSPQTQTNQDDEAKRASVNSGVGVSDSVAGDFTTFDEWSKWFSSPVSKMGLDPYWTGVAEVVATPVSGFCWFVGNALQAE